MKPKINLFEQRDVRDYNSHTLINSIRNNCVRAVELDDRQQSKKKGSYLVAMKTLADAIYQELGVKPTKGSKTKPVIVEDSKEYKELSSNMLIATDSLAKAEEELTSVTTRSEEQEGELEESDKVIEEKDKEIDSLNSDCETMATKIKDLEAAHKKEVITIKGQLTKAKKKGDK